MQRITVFVLTVVLGGLLPGCATSMNTMHPARVLPKGSWHVGYGVGANIPAGPIWSALMSVVRISDDLADGQTLSEDRADRLLESALAIAVSPPTGTNEIQVRYGLGRRLELGLKWAISSIWADLRYQLFDTDVHGADGWTGSVGLGVGYNYFSGVIFDVLKYVDIDGFKKVDLKVPLLFGRSWGGQHRFFRLWMGPLLIASWYQLDEKLGRDYLDSGTPLVGTTSGWWFHGGAQVGIAGGYRWVWVMLELTVTYLKAHASLLGRRYDLGGVVVAPMLGLMTRF